MSIHDGHRQRVKERFRKKGLDDFEAHQVLELLLFYCIPRRDTNVVAHKLIDRFGTFDQVLDASVRELEKVEGMGKSAAEYIALIRNVGRYYQVSRNAQKKALTSIEACGKYLTAFFDGKKNEEIYLLCLDAKCMVLNCLPVNDGGTYSVNVPMRKIVDTAIASGAASVVLAHNHPGGVTTPSPEDISCTVKVAQALRPVEVVLNDHIIVADGEYLSFVQAGLYRSDMA